LLDRFFGLMIPLQLCYRAILAIAGALGLM
jgi:hypothetical protein